MMKSEEYIYMKTLVEKDKCDWINKKKVELLIDLLIMRISQLFCLIGVVSVYIAIWYFCSSSDVLYLIGWWIITGVPISMGLCCCINTAIKTYKKYTLKRINKIANIKFKGLES